MKILHYPHTALRRKAKPIKTITDSIWRFAEAMLEAMYEDRGVGLAAPQVGESVCLITLDTTGEQEGERVFINPSIVDRKGDVCEEEGCLSLPGLHGRVRRAERVSVVAWNLEGRKIELDADGLAARAFQHEIDHLRGILFIDHLSPADQMAVRSRLKELERAFEKENI